MRISRHYPSVWLTTTRCAWVIGILLALAWMPRQAEAATMYQGTAAYSRGDYVRASSIFIPLAERGDAAAQAFLGFLFETGRGVPQNYSEAAMWYRRSAEQGNGAAQYSLGLLYDKGYGVPRDQVEAYRWLNLSTSVAAPRDRERREKIRDAIGSKMRREEIALSRSRALGWAPSREH
jgi:hypothetical protein